MTTSALIEINDMHKAFGSTIALKKVSLRIYRGEIHGLVGENGSGKSTITSILAGMQPATSGNMHFQGKPWAPSTMVEAQKNGISMVLQEANTISSCTVAENVFAGREKLFTTLGFVRNSKMIAAADKLLADFGITHISAKDPISKYSFEDQKLVEIVRAITNETKVLVIDETTTALSHDGRALLYTLMDTFVARHGTVIFISHDIDEILSKCTFVSVLRDGDIVGELDREALAEPNVEHKIKYLMVGRELKGAYYREDFIGTYDDVVTLMLRNVTAGPICDFSLQLHQGEILGIGGLSGCGMHDIGKIAFGQVKPERGCVECRGKPIHNPAQAVASSIGYISKDRDKESIILEASIETNIVMPSLPDISRITFIDPRREHRISQEGIVSLSIKCFDEKQWVSTLSGGNKQKVSFAKWIAKGSDIIIMDCPTRGVDVGVKQAMYQLINEMKRAGKSILMISEELAELIGMVDRLVIMKDYKISKVFERSANLKETDIIEYMI